MSRQRDILISLCLLVAGALSLRAYVKRMDHIDWLEQGDRPRFYPEDNGGGWAPSA